jgi:hypothetical protein
MKLVYMYELSTADRERERALHKTEEHVEPLISSSSSSIDPLPSVIRVEAKQHSQCND